MTDSYLDCIMERSSLACLTRYSERKRPMRTLYFGAGKIVQIYGTVGLLYTL